ncbi:uncharacterized protein ABDE67_004319 [Symphorus nematophorus]
MKEGSVVANLATDLNLDVKTLNQRKMRLDIIANKKYLDVNKETGELYIVEKIDREYLCPTKSSASCYLKLEVILENPLRIFNIEVEILDMNDNAPQFRRDAIHLDISEATPKGERFSLSNAVDPDVGSNSVKTYHLSESEHFNIEVQTGRDGSKFAELILIKTLDREQQAAHNLILTAVDGGTPARSGTASVIVHVLDTNDNAPAFDKVNYNIKVMENSPIGSLVIHLNATDLDEGSNSDITYSYSLYTSEKTQETFNLNPSTGEITVKGTLNYEDFKIYDMEVIATDKGANSLSGQCTIKILVEDMNDNHPEISIKSFQSPVNENIELDTVIAVVSVSDKDSGDNGVVDLHIPDNMPFKLRESSDNYYELVVSEPLDREKVPEYDITFTVTDRGSPPLSDNETMTLELLDVNDNVPQFPRSFYTIRVMENNAPGALLSSLTAFDPDLHENQYLVYFILEKEIANTSMSMLFSINPENGNLYALKTFDYEIEKEFLFHIEARDSGSPPLSSNVTVHIVIVDQNDNAPVIVSPWRAHGSVVEEKIPRSTDKGSLVAKVIALDTDSVHNSRITYQFLQVTDATLFSLDQYNGEIRTMRMFSYRDPRHQRLVVVAKDNGEPALSATVTIKLSTVETAVKAYSDMTEVPLEYDIFSDLNLYLVIGLGSVSFLLLITILVTIVLKCQKPKPSKAAPPCRNSVISERNSTIADSTLVSNDAYWYSLFLAETRKGKLVVRQPVPKGSRYIVSSIPRGTGLTDTSDSAASTLQLLDVNDNVPQFPRSFYTIRVMENNAPGALLSSLTAFDPDLHENQYLVYFILEKEIANTSMSMLFSINPENGNLYALKTFDYEIEKEFLFHIEARDSGSPPLSSNVTVHIVIVDQNDNAPVIVSPWRAHGSVVEEKIPRSTDKGSLVAKVIALDTDSVHNSRITYQFLQVTDATLFSLDQYNGEIRTMRMFSYRDPRHQRLVVVAKDNGEPALSATVTIKLSTVETAVKAYSDMTEVPLEYDIFSDLNLYLVIGLGSVSFLLLITILVTIVLKCQKPKPSKAAPPCRNSVISERNSTIADSTLVSNDAYWYSLFLAETRKGKLVVRQPVPKGSRYIVSSIPRGTGLTDTSDSAASTLQIRQYYRRGCVSVFLFLIAIMNTVFAVTHYSVPEEMEEGSVVANLAADLGLDVKTLKIRKMRVDVVGNKKYLDINKDTGELIILERIDREFLCPLKTATSCFLKLDAAIENPIRMFNIEVEITDINDNAPHFRRGTMHLDISESSSTGERFSLNNAADPDVGTNSVKDYHLSTSEHFALEIQTGRDGSKFADLILKKALDREQQAVHNLILTAVDGGVPTRTGTASIIVRVLDVNDNAPSFDKDKYVVEVMENSPIGSLVIKLNATDLDEGSNSDIVYSYSLYTSERTQQMFNLNPENGEIRVKEMINYEDVKLYEMEVIASDKGPNSLSGQCKLTIQVTDMNDNHPEISIKSFQSPIKENEPIDTVIAVVSVSDKDSGDNGVVDLHIPDNMPFKLRESSDRYFELVVSEPLDREKVPEYDITFTVTDRGSPPLSDNETMTLELLDVNDNVPQFPRSFYTIRVMENNAPGALLSSLTAFDPDLHENQYLVYFILEKEIANTSMSMLFSINPENGNLYALKTFDFEIEKEFLFHIEARDSGSPPLSSNVTVHIVIVDQNDNAPVIVSPWRAHGSVVEEKIPRSTDKGSLVAKVIALDTDSVHNSRITYQFLQVTDATLFSLDQYNGEIRTMRMFSYRDPRHQRLVVVAKDNGEPALSATVTIKLSTVETAVKAYSDMTEVPLEYDIFSDLNLYLVIGLGSVSFLLLITILVTIVLKCQKPKPSKAAPPCRNSVISERNSTIADSTLVSNDAYWYSLFLAETRKGKLVVRQPVPKGSRYIVSSIPRGTGLTDTSDSAASTLQLLDVNDNVPQFPRSFYTIRVMENNAPGALLSSLTAFDPDLHENQYLVYFILEKEIANTSMSMLFSINPENGNLYALKTFDFEIEKEFLFHIEARDSGSPPLSSNVTVHIIIVDQNDNAPVIVSPWRAHGSVVEEKIPRSTDKGSLVAKVIALDTDSVHNSRITYQFLQVTDATLFSLDQYNGEIRTMRMFSYRDPRHQRLVVVAKDNGEPALSATVTIKLSTVETAVKAYSDMTEVPLEYDIFSDLNLYLVIGLGSVSFLLLITILVTIVLKCQKPKPSKAAPPCRNSVISERNSTIADSTLVSNDAYWYSLFLAETRKGKLVVRQPVPKGSRYIVSSIPRGTGLTDTSDSAASTLQTTVRKTR